MAEDEKNLNPEGDAEAGQPFREGDGPKGGNSEELAETSGETMEAEKPVVDHTPALDAQEEAMGEVPEEPAEDTTGGFDPHKSLPEDNTVEELLDEREADSETDPEKDEDE